jgi:HEAT repeats
MAASDGLFLAWSFAGGLTTLAAATGGRAIFTQWRANSASNRQAETWTLITDAATKFCNGDDDAAKIVAGALGRPASQRIAVEALANLARIDARVAERLRGQTKMVEHIRSWVLKELTHSDAGRRCAAAEIVGALRIRACRGAVAMATNDDEPSVRVASCRALAVIDPDHAIGILLGLVEKDGVWAADLLSDLISREDGEFSGTDAVVQRANEWAATPALLKLLANGRMAGAERVMIGALDAEDDAVRANAAEALRESPSPAATKALLGMLGDSNEDIRLSAVRALGHQADAAYAMDLAAMLGDESRLVRFAAGSALAGTPGGRALLLRATDGADPKAVEAAHVALWQAEQSFGDPTKVISPDTAQQQDSVEPADLVESPDVVDVGAVQEVDVDPKPTAPERSVSGAKRPAAKPATTKAATKVTKAPTKTATTKAAKPARTAPTATSATKSKPAAASTKQKVETKSLPKQRKVPTNATPKATPTTASKATPTGASKTTASKAAAPKTPASKAAESKAAASKTQPKVAPKTRLEPVAAIGPAPATSLPKLNRTAPPENNGHTVHIQSDSELVAS